MTRFPGVEALILKTLLEEGEVRPPEERLAQEYFWQAAAALQARGLCVADQAAGVVRRNDLQEVEAPLPSAKVIDLMIALRESLSPRRHGSELPPVPDAFRPRPVHDLRARCALLVQRWRQAGGERAQCANGLEEVLGETEPEKGGAA